MLFKPNYGIKFRGGFGIIEILAVVAIISILAVISYTAFFDANRAQALEKDRDKVSAMLEYARSLTLSSSGGQQFGVHIESDKVILFPGSVYSAGNPSNKIELLHPLVTIASSSISGGGSDIVFERLTGKTSDYGTIGVSLRSDSNEFYVITVSATGLIEVE